jgi:formate dehydrogenase major subunit
MTLHFQDEVMTNFLTIDATDPKAGTAEFKAAAIRVEPLVQRGGGESALVHAAVPDAAVPDAVAR